MQKLWPYLDAWLVQYTDNPPDPPTSSCHITHPKKPPTCSPTLMAYSMIPHLKIRVLPIYIPSHIVVSSLLHDALSYINLVALMMGED
ncbi:hypothetical protein O6P43_000731 [Quillaja saponaria]|uniref:Uncharacterized protein n=1 Tax=Quillaja saponaria TaxID=32244 RepID=A0AAD7VMH1_QUISA|nr:hypothetical protein O6P43_000731 [Quillaja saponaria]